MFDLEKAILEHTKYNGKRENPYTYSASMSGNTLLQNYLIVVHGSQEEHRIGDNTLGTLFHKGIETMIKDDAYDQNLLLCPEEPAKLKLSNGWDITGTSDLSVYNRSGRLLEIHDYKLVKQYKVKVLMKDVQIDPYAKQLHINRFIRAEREDSFIPTRLIIQAFSKDANIMEGESTYNKIMVQQEPLFQTNLFLNAETDRLQGWIESGNIPPECTADEKWLRKSKKTGLTIASRCTFYCSMGRSGLCPYYKPTVTQATRVMAGW